jgi:hypothetical protein
MAQDNGNLLRSRVVTAFIFNSKRKINIEGEGKEQRPLFVDGGSPGLVAALIVGIGFSTGVIVAWIWAGIH